MHTKRVFIAGLFLLGAVMVGTAVFITSSAYAAPNQTITVTMTNDVLNNLDGQCSLREAVIAANSNSASGILVGECNAGDDNATDIITLADGQTYTLSLAGNGEDAAATGDLDIIDDLPLLDIQFVVAGDGSAIIDASSIGDDDRVLHILGAGVELNNISIRGGDAKIGALVTDGGGIYNNNGTLTINGGEITNNTAVNGGGIYNNGTILGKGQVTLNDVDVILNNTTSSGNGGGLASFGSRAAVSLTNDTLFRANNSANEGGGIYMDDGALTVDGSIINLNMANGHGGGIRAATAATVTITDSTMDSNQAQNGGSGGAVYAGSTDISGSTFQSNSGSLGGALFFSSTDRTNITNSVLINNSADYGGAIRAQAISAVNIRVENNQASVDGGGLHLVGTPAKEIVNSVIISNTADSAGGGIYINAGDIDISQTAVAYNDAIDGGGIWTDSDGTFVSNSTISNNAAKNGGGVYIEQTAAMTITNVTIAFSISADQDVYKMGDLTLQNSIIYTPGTDSCLGSLSKPLVISLGDNLTDDNSCNGLTGSGDEVNVNVALASLADNGGNTLTHNLLAGSPAIDSGNPAACVAAPVNNVDQRGTPRIIGSACDKGAVERGAVVFTPVILK